MTQRARILIVEDNRDVSDVLQLFLKRRNYELAVAYCGLTGLAIAKATRPDLVLLNVQMPGMNGLAVLRELREDPRTRDLKVIMATGYSHIPAHPGAASAQDFLLYPIRRDEMYAKISRVLAS